MVQNREVKEDVFAGFEIDLEVRDNYDRKLKEETEEQLKGPYQFRGEVGDAKEDVFAQFKIPGVDESEQKRRQLEDEEAVDAAAVAASAALGNSSRRSRLGSKNPGRMTSGIFVPSKNNLNPKLQSERFIGNSERNKNNVDSKHQSERGTGNGQRYKSKTYPRQQSERFMLHSERYQTKSNLQAGRSFDSSDDRTDSNNRIDDKKVVPRRRPVRTVSVPLGAKRFKQVSDLKSLIEDESITNTDDFPTQFSFSEDTKPDGIQSEKQNSKVTGTAGETAKFVPGAVAVSAGEELMDDIFRLEKPDNDIFADFDLDAIVRDYETLQRKLNYAPRKDDKTVGENEIDESDHYVNLRYRNLKQMWLDHFPRMHGIIFRILLPLWILLSIAIGLGYVLANMEEESEYQSNDAVMRNRFLLEQFPYNESLKLLFGLPTTCFEFYLMLKMNQTNETVEPKVVDIINWGGDIFPEITSLNTSSNDDIENIFEEIDEFLAVCESVGTTVVAELLEYAETKASFESAVESSLTFNWIRCWDTYVYGDVNPIFPSEAQIAAANNQSLFYSATWDANRKRLFDYYSDEFDCANMTCQKAAFERSINEATGSDMCGLNNGASAWFWFIIMTTIGYGNQSPTTTQGRTLVVSLGWISILCWAVVLVVAGKVVGIIIDDIFRKCHMRFLTGEVVGATLFGLVGWVWIYVTAVVAEQWWQKRLENYDSTPQDAFWWSYISLFTIGLGDYFLEPEVIFYSDVALWSFMFLTGFTFLCTFLDRVALLCEGYFPDSGEALKERIKNTNLVGIMAIEYKQKNQMALENIGKLVKKMDDDDVKQVVKRVTRIRQKKELLVHLLYQTEEELDHFTKRGEQYESHGLARLCREENMLEEVLEKTRKERERMAHYREAVLEDGVP